MSLDVDLWQGETCVFSANTTHNLSRMAHAAGVYDACWQPHAINAKLARDIIPPLRDGIAKMKADPDGFKMHDSPNGWGTYKFFVPWLEDYLKACEEYPDAVIHVCV